MQLLIERGQHFNYISGRFRFRLWAKFECNSEETGLIDKYSVRDALLTEGKPGQLKKAAIIAAVITVVVAPIPVIIAAVAKAFMLPIPDLIGLMVTNPAGLVFIYIIALYLVYNQIREQIKVEDVLTGRNFTCKTVVAVIAKEQEIVVIADCFRLVLEAMKNWGGKEIVEIAPLKEPAKRLIERPHETA